MFLFYSVSSFVKKTTEKINTLQMNSDLWQRPESREGGHPELSVTTAMYLEEMDNEWVNKSLSLVLLTCAVVGWPF